MMEQYVNKIKYFSAFAGIGGFDLGIQQACPDWECVGYSEIDKYAEAIYQYNFKGATNYGDVTAIRPDELPDFDMFCGGFPCQSFSIAGKRRGFEDTRGTMFFEICRIVRVKKPKYLFLENVKGIFSHDKGNTFETILESLAELGYDVQWQCVNSRLYVPQNRERVFIIGHIREIARPKVFPIGGNCSEINELQGQTVNTITARYLAAQAGGSYIIESEQQTQDKGIGDTTKKPYQGQSNYIIHNVYGGFGEEKPREFHDYSPTIRTPKGGGHIPMVVQPDLAPNMINKIRRLTPIECERLQGFPDNYTKYGIINGKQVEISDSQRYKCCGNAVTVNVIKHIADKLKLF